MGAFGGAADMSDKSQRKRSPNCKPQRETKPQTPFFRPFAGQLVAPKRATAELKESNHSATRGSPPELAATGRGVERDRRQNQPSRLREPEPAQLDETTVFERLMAGVEPLGVAKAKRVSRTQTDVGSSLVDRARTFAMECEAADREALRKLHALVHDGFMFDVVDDGHHIEGKRRGTDGCLLRRMRDGELLIDATVDLAGECVDDARVVVSEFVRDRRLAGDRVVLVVFGKGGWSGGRRLILRGEVAAWLSEGEGSEHVAAFSTAPTELGGERAMCVLLAQLSDTHRGMG